MPRVNGWPRTAPVSHRPFAYVARCRCDVGHAISDTKWALPLFCVGLGTRLGNDMWIVNIIGFTVILPAEVTGCILLHLACQEGKMDVAKYLIEEQRSRTSCKDSNGLTPLLLACEGGHLLLAKYLIEEQQCDPVC